MRLVVCDGDVTLRSVVSKMAESVGHTVIAETDSAVDAVELVSRFGAEVLVLDLSLPFGSGVQAVNDIRDMALPCQIVVFTNYAGNAPDLRGATVRALVGKPDFEELERVLGELAAGAGPAESGGERRRVPRERPLVPPAVVHMPSGLEEPDSFAAVVDVLEPGDGVLYVNVAAPPGIVDPWAKLVHTDRFLAIGRTLRTVLRVQDRVSVDADQLATLLLDAERVGVESAWNRLEQAHDRAGIGGVISGGWALCQEGESPFAVMTRAREAAARSVGQPGDRLWAG